MRQKQMFDSEPLRPPVDGQVLRVARWPEVFETAHSRKHRSLQWISCPVSFNSTGYQRLLDSFDTWEAAALYGGWQALCQLAAQSELRGRLCGQKGEPYNTRRIARLTGMGLEIFEVLIPWALQVGWLEWSLPDAPYSDSDSPVAEPVAEVSENTGHATDSEPVPQVGIVDSEASPLPNPTQPNPTRQNPTQPCAEGGDVWNAVQQQLQLLGVTAPAVAIRNAKGLGWSSDHAASVVAWARDRPGAWNGYALFQRFQLPASVPAADGWPEPSAEWAARKTADRLYSQQQAEEARRKAAKASARASPAAPMAAELKKRMQNVAQRSPLESLSAEG